MSKILKRYPPNYHEILKALPSVKNRPNAIFTYAPYIYWPAGLSLPLDFHEHEEVHIQQQNALEGGAAEWWTRYLQDPKFRLEQELQAYRVQWQYAKIYNRKKRRELLQKIAGDLSSPMYGNLLTKEQAIESIQNVETKDPEDL